MPSARREERILFIIPPYFDADDYVGNERAHVLPSFTIPYGILSLDAYLRAHCQVPVRVDILDLNLLLRQAVEAGDVSNILETFSRSIEKRVHDVCPSIVGISALFNVSFQYMGQISAVARAAAPHALIVAGGGLPSAGFRQVLEHCPSIDAVCRGEGEIPLRDLIEADDRREVLERHPSWMTRRGIALGKIPAHTFVQNLDEIPMLDYGLVNLDDYNSRSIDKRYVGQPKREMAIHTSRGCPFLCVFCSNPSLHGAEVRAMSVTRVAAEVRRMKEQWGMTVLLIEDDHFFFDKARAKQVLRELIDLGVRVEFPNGIAVYAIDEEVASLFQQAGVSTVALAVESGSDYVLHRIIKKPLKTSLVKGKVELLRKYGVQSHVFIVLGLPGELDEHRQQTLDLLLDVGFDWVHVFCAVPILGSRLYDICVANGYLETNDVLDHVNTKSVIRAPGVDPKAIQAYAYEMNLLVNFVHNYNLKIGRFDTAAKYFENVIGKYPDHALAYYALSRAYDGLGRGEEADRCRRRYRDIIERDAWWRERVRKYGLPEAEDSATTPPERDLHALIGP
jgi:radical SAM superfamily enzyme YgiQ (UPF0313 family)